MSGIVFRRNVAPWLIDSDRLLLVSEDERLVLSGAPFVAASKFLNGQQTREDLDRLLEPTTREALRELESRGLLVTVDKTFSPMESGFWESLRTSAEEAASRLRDFAVTLVNLSRVGPGQLAEAIGSLHGSVREEAPLLLVQTDDYLDPRVTELAAEAEPARRAWMPVKLTGRSIWIGPLFLPGSGPGWKFVATRMWQNRWIDSQVLAVGGTSPSPPPIATACTVALGACLAASELAQWVCGTATGLEEGILTIDPARMSVAYHSLKQPAGVSGLDHLVSPICGLIRNVAPWGWKDAPLYLYRAEHVTPLRNGIATEPHSAIGTGFSEAEARRGCLAEAAERYSCWFHGTEPLLRARAGEIAGPFLRPSELLLRSDQQDPPPVDETREADWTQAHSLEDSSPVWVPSSYCYFGHPENATYCPSSSNGCAAAESFDDAVLYGLLELVERDAVALWWYNRLVLPSIAFSEAGDARTALLGEWLESRGRRCHLLDLTSDFGIPVCAAVTSDSGTRTVYAFGAALTFAVAARRAAREMCQVLAGFEGPGLPEPLQAWIEGSRLADHPYLQGVPGRPQPAGKGPRNLHECAAKARELGIRVYTQDLTRPGVGLRVARVIAPGLRTLEPNFAPGRLYDVPVKLGRLSRAHREEEMNRQPCLG